MCVFSILRSYFIEEAEFYEKILNLVHESNADVMLKITWKIANLNYKLAIKNDHENKTI